MKWIYLSPALVCESAGFAIPKLSQGFTKTIPTIVTVLVDLIALAFFVLALKNFDPSFVYMIAAGVGTVLVVLTNGLIFKQPLNRIQIACIIFIIVGSVVL
jgi:multidrug transporter EmrE-like cation transporter